MNLTLKILINFTTLFSALGKYLLRSSSHWFKPLSLIKGLVILIPGTSDFELIYEYVHLCQSVKRFYLTVFVLTEYHLLNSEEKHRKSTLLLHAKEFTTMFLSVIAPPTCTWLAWWPSVKFLSSVPGIEPETRGKWIGRRIKLISEI